MPFAPHIRATAIGRIGNDAERFSYNISMALPDSDVEIGNMGGVSLVDMGTFTANGDVWADLADDIRTFHSAPETLVSQYAVLEEVKFARIGADGKYLEDPVIVNVVDAPGGSGSLSVVPPQTALAISLTTDRRGATGRGRFFLPMPHLTLDPQTMLASEAQVLGIRGQAVNLINNLENAPGIDVLNLRVVVASSKGYNTPVSGVRVGRAIDTIRSRRRGLLESHTTVAGAGGG